MKYSCAARKLQIFSIIHCDIRSCIEIIVSNYRIQFSARIRQPSIIRTSPFLDRCEKVRSGRNVLSDKIHALTDSITLTRSSQCNSVCVAVPFNIQSQCVGYSTHRKICSSINDKRLYNIPISICWGYSLSIQCDFDVPIIKSCFFRSSSSYNRYSERER